MSGGSLLNRSEGIYAGTPVGRAALLLTHPLRTWAVEQAMRHGQVTFRDVRCEFPTLPTSTIRHGLNQLVDAGWLRRGDTYQPGNYPQPHVQQYLPADTSSLTALRDYLNTLLEAHHDEPRPE